MMEIVLPNGRKTSRLAFGCGGIGAALGYRDSHRCLFAAYESGFTHFDVAPSYGLGAAEKILGRFLREIADQNITLTTKAGIGRPSYGYRWMLGAQSIAAPYLRSFPSLRRRFGDRARRSAGRGKFVKAELEASLEASLRTLMRDYIDLFLMHELHLEDIDDELFAFLERKKQEGKIGTYGFGSCRDEADRIMACYPKAMPVIQTNWSLLDKPLMPSAGVITNYYGVLKNAGPFQDRLQADDRFRKKMKTEFASELATPEQRRRALLSAAIRQSENGLIIVSSTKADHIAELANGRLHIPQASRSGLIRSNVE